MRKLITSMLSLIAVVLVLSGCQAITGNLWGRTSTTRRLRRPLKQSLRLIKASGAHTPDARQPPPDLPLMKTRRSPIIQGAR